MRMLRIFCSTLNSRVSNALGLALTVKLVSS